ncbi:MAG: hypothetical protein PHO00_00985 [bacterium]|nr:hypothetical protein [bacterium]
MKKELLKLKWSMIVHAADDTCDSCDLKGIQNICTLCPVVLFLKSLLKRDKKHDE